MICTIIILALTVLTYFPQRASAGALSFKAEADRATEALNCPRPKIMPASSGLGGPVQLHSWQSRDCEVLHQSESAHWASKERQADVERLVRRCWLRDSRGQEGGAGVFTCVCTLYAPNMEKKLTSIFFSNFNTTLEVADYRIAYTYSRGPKIDERLFVIAPREQDR